MRKTLSNVDTGQIKRKKNPSPGTCASLVREIRESTKIVGKAWVAPATGCRRPKRDYTGDRKPAKHQPGFSGKDRYLVISGQ